jgi:hypothetical protein
MISSQIPQILDLSSPSSKNHVSNSMTLWRQEIISQLKLNVCGTIYNWSPNWERQTKSCSPLQNTHFPSLLRTLAVKSDFSLALHNKAETSGPLIRNVPDTINYNSKVHQAALSLLDLVVQSLKERLLLRSNALLQQAVGKPCERIDYRFSDYGERPSSRRMFSIRHCYLPRCQFHFSLGSQGQMHITLVTFLRLCEDLTRRIRLESWSWTRLGCIQALAAFTLSKPTTKYTPRMERFAILNLNRLWHRIH